MGQHEIAEQKPSEEAELLVDDAFGAEMPVDFLKFHGLLVVAFHVHVAGEGQKVVAVVADEDDRRGQVADLGLAEREREVVAVKQVDENDVQGSAMRWFIGNLAGR